MLSDMYEHGRSTLIYKAAQSYLDSEYYGSARLLFQKVTTMDHDDVRARFMFLYASAFASYFKNRLVRALCCAQEALALTMNPDDRRPYDEPLKQLVADLSKDLRKRGELKEESAYADLRV
jgi:hypothetical protein